MKANSKQATVHLQDLITNDQEKPDYVNRTQSVFQYHAIFQTLIEWLLTSRWTKQKHLILLINDKRVTDFCISTEAFIVRNRPLITFTIMGGPVFTTIYKNEGRVDIIA